MKKIIIFSSLIFLLYSCRSVDEEASYSFFVAGHTYGSPAANNQGLHPPFIDTFSWLNDREEIEFGILTGDIVRRSDTASWDSVDKQLSLLSKEIFFCPGNHDTYNRELYESRYGDPYYSFEKGHELFIILDGNIDNWNISGKQLKFLEFTLANLGTQTEQVFIFIHQLVWWDEHNVFAQVRLNWPPYTPDTTNYWGTIEPRLQILNVPVTIFAGDLGANEKATPVMYHRDDNITYIASGMGNGKTDNFIIVSVRTGEDPVFELISLGKDKTRLGELEDYWLR